MPQPAHPRESEHGPKTQEHFYPSFVEHAASAVDHQTDGEMGVRPGVSVFDQWHTDRSGATHPNTPVAPPEPDWPETTHASAIRQARGTHEKSSPSF